MSSELICPYPTLPYQEWCKMNDRIVPNVRPCLFGQRHWRGRWSIVPGTGTGTISVFISTFLHLSVPPKHEPPDPLAGPQFLIGPLRPSSWPLDPSAGVLTLQLVFQKLWMPSWPSIWPDRPSSWTLDPPIYLSDHLAGLSDRIKQNSTEFNKIQQNSAKFNKIQLLRN